MAAAFYMIATDMELHLILRSLIDNSGKCEIDPSVKIYCCLLSKFQQFY